MSEVPAVVDGAKPEAKRPRGAYSISLRLQRALALLATGEAKTQIAACEAAQMTPRAFQLAIKKSHVQQYMQQMIMQTLGVGAMRAANRMTELLASSNPMAGYHAAKFVLGAGAGVTMPERPGVAISVNIQQAGYVIDLREPAERDDGAVICSSVPSAAPVTIEGTAVGAGPRNDTGGQGLQQKKAPV